MLRALPPAILAGMLLVTAPYPCAADENAFWGLRAQVREAEARRDWSRAAALTRRILTDHRADDFVEAYGRRTEIGLFQLYLLDLDGAQKELEAAVEARDDKGSYQWLDSSQTLAAYGLARVAAERGDYKSALVWLERYENALGAGCGNCAEAREQEAHLLRTVWRSADLPRKEARKRMQRIAAGAFAPLPARLPSGKGGSQRSRAIREAELVLAKLSLAEGRRREARTLLQRLAGGGDTHSYLAEAHLRKLDGATPEADR